MNNMRRGFTMIELIFVIVIIGILAAVAIPKLAATRDDAKTSASVANLRILIGDAKTKYLSAGGNVLFAALNWSDVTNVAPASGVDVTTANTFSIAANGNADIVWNIVYNPLAADFNGDAVNDPGLVITTGVGTSLPKYLSVSTAESKRIVNPDFAGGTSAGANGQGSGTYYIELGGQGVNFN